MTKPTTFIGGDPGSNGGLVALGRDGWVRSDVAQPYLVLSRGVGTRQAIVEWLRQFDSGYRPCTCIAMVEKNHSSPQMGVASAFTFGVNCERIAMAITAMGISLQEVRPQDWQAGLGIPTRKKQRISVGLTSAGKPRVGYRYTETQGQFKGRLRRFAEELFPDLELWREPKYIQMAVCDALLIAEYCWRTADTK